MADDDDDGCPARDRNKELLTTVDGYTIDKPYFWFPGIVDWTEWYEVLEAVQAEVQSRGAYLEKLRERLRKRALILGVPFDDLSSQDEGDLHTNLLRYRKEYDEAGSSGGRIQPVLRAANTGACLLDLIDDATEFLEGRPLRTPGSPSSGKKGGPIETTLITLGVTAAIGGAVYLGIKHRAKVRSAGGGMASWAKRRFSGSGNSGEAA